MTTPGPAGAARPADAVRAPVLVLSYWNLNRVAFGGGRRIEALLKLLDDRVLLCQPAPPHPRWPTVPFRFDLGRRKIGFNWGIFNFFLPGASNAVRRAIRERKPALVVLTSIWAWAPLRPLRDRPPIVLDAHDVLAAAIAERFGGGHPFARCVAAWERRAVHATDLVIACSDADARAFRARYRLGPDRVVVVPNGADLPERTGGEIDPSVAARLAGADVVLLFMGKLDYQPNVAALRFLFDELMPALERAAPGRFRLLVVGGPRPPVEAPPGVVMAGRVPDVGPYLERADLCLAPIFTGSGTRLKILEYLAAGRPVVATAKGAEGLDVETGRHLWIAEAGRFAEAILELASNAGRCRAMGQEGRELVRRLYSWDAIRQRWRAALARWLEPA